MSLRNGLASSHARTSWRAFVLVTFYTLLETAKLAGVDPAKYLRAASLAAARGEVLLPSGAFA